VRQFTPRKENPPLAGGAFQAYISTQAVDLPLESATWVDLAHFYDITNLEIGEHERIITHDIMPKWSQPRSALKG